MSKIEVDAIVPQSGTTLTVGEAGDTVDISNATLSANLNANNLTSGTIPDARFPATLPAVDGSNLTNVQIVGGYTACDAITVTNTDTFALTAGGSAVSPESANNCIVSLNGVIQAPGTSYTISGSNIVFASALSAGSDVIDFITVLGTALNVGTVSDGAITTAKLGDGAVTSAKLDSGVALGKVLQVVQTLKTDTFSTSGTNSFEDVTGMSVNITPTSASNKIFIMVNLGCVSLSSANTAHFRLLRDATVVGDGDSAGSRISSNAADFGDANNANVVSFNLLDSPSTTSQITYKIQIYPNAASYVNRMSIDSDNDIYTRSSSTITVMEIGA